MSVPFYQRAAELGLLGETSHIWEEVLRGVVGSHAYGLATADSDVDRMSVALAPSEEFLGFHPPTASSGTRVQHEPEDHVIHELGKYLTLALKSNPSILELLWLPQYELITPVGEDLVRMRDLFPSRELVKSTYLGYAFQQFTRLKARGDGTFSSDTRNRSLKHARHLLRLVQQGLQLYKTGEITVRVHDPEGLFDLAQKIVDNPDVGQLWMDTAKRLFEEATSVLPEEPAYTEVEDWLIKVRTRRLFADPVEISE